MRFSKDSEHCKKCKHYDDCNNKRMVACALCQPQPLQQLAAESNSMPLMRPLLKDNSYTLREQITKEIEKELYKDLYCDLYFGA